MTNIRTEIDLDKIINRKTKSYPYVELDETYIGEFLVRNNFLIVRFNKKLYHIQNNKLIRNTDIDIALINLVKNANDDVIKAKYSLSKNNVVEAIYRKIVVSKKEIIKYDLMNSIYNKDNESALAFLKSINIL
ncbi:MAG: hypothetical protein U0U67_16510 [Chitinophagales bacterium]